eukprot:TRINITY_DN1091_c0_g1_i3.p1 TRINITY_DN1091_c0_g1~~TRINITY_DN1091_c0_g1_i3.p1  ORF type:complete len:354 (+),score=111.54 TRINITY_DN1091_c0_g1_i3:74-1063(+)
MSSGLRLLTKRFYSKHALFLAGPKTCSIIGAPIGLGQPLIGVERGPSVIRKAGVVSRIAKEGWRIEDTGDLKFPHVSAVVDPPNLKHAVHVGSFNEVLHNQAYDHAKNGKFTLVMGGDHSIAIGSISAILRARPDVGVIWVDAHADLNTNLTSHSGNIHGMAVSFLMNHIELSNVPGFGWLAELNKQHRLLPERIVYVGLRDVDAPEKIRLRELGIKAFSMQHIDKYGIGKVMEMSLDYLCGKQSRPLHLSVDIDSVDPIFAPSTGTVVRGGLTDREAHYICEATCETGLLGSMDIVEVNPILAPGDGAHSTADMAARLVGAALGDTIL